MTDEPKTAQGESAQADGKTKVERKAYKLKRPHRHGGELIPEGGTVHLTARQAERLRKAENPKI